MALTTPVAWELRPVQLSDRDTFAPYLTGLSQPLSDYTFAQVYGWRTALNLWWRIIDGHLCVFANGSNLSLLMPPLAPTGTSGMQRALRRACEIMDDYNAELAAQEWSGRLVAPHIESISDELMERMPGFGYAREPQRADYVYDVADMIELSGGAFKSKRHDKNHFMRAWRHRAERFDVARDAEACTRLLEIWHQQSDTGHAGEDEISTLKRLKESLAAGAQILDAQRLGLTGMCVRVEGSQVEGGEKREAEHPGEPFAYQAPGAPTDLQEPGPPAALVAFTLGEPLGSDMSSILVEKADREYRGLAQFIFSEFCRTCWADRPLVNAGDDWGLETLARTKQSYRPVRMLAKHALTRLRPVSVLMPAQPEADSAWAGRLEAAAAESYQPLTPLQNTTGIPGAVDSSNVPEQPVTFRSAELADLPAAMALEQKCFTDAYPLSRRQLRHLQRSRSAIFVVAAREAAEGSTIVGEGIALLRRHPGRDGGQRLSGRIYTLAVDPSERGKGTGRRLLEVLLDELRQRGVGRVFLEVAEDNGPAIALYDCYGFVDIGKLPDYYAPSRHARHMVKVLEPAVGLRRGMRVQNP